MNGADSLVHTLLNSGVDTCFANPGTSEMHFVAALDRNPDLRCILCLFEGGATGAADGYGRMTGDLAVTLLHLAPGFGNGFANIHNARKAGTGVLNIVGDHADYHLKYESPLKGDLAGISQAVSHWTRTSANGRSVAVDGAAAIEAARSNNGQIATLILPANTAWETAEAAAQSAAPQPTRRPSVDAIENAADRLRQPGTVLMIGGAGLYGAGRAHAGQIAHQTGCRLLADTLVGRIARGEGTAVLEQLFYPVDAKLAQMENVSDLILCGTERPVTFFAYPGKPSLPEPAGCTVASLCDPLMDIEWTLATLAAAVGASESSEFARVPYHVPTLPSGTLTLEKTGDALAALLPENAIIVNESVTAGSGLLPATATARSHDLLNTSGGAIGQALPCAVGAAAACPDRKVVVLTGDGSAMYTLQSLWTMAREKLDITIVVVGNRGYQILHDELVNVGAGSAGKNARRMFDIVEPELNWVLLAEGHGVAAARATDMESFNDAFAKGLAMDGPYLIEIVVPESD